MRDYQTSFRKFLNWALIWIGLANVPFMAMWFVGAPPRYFEIAVAGLVGLVMKRMPRIIQWTAFVLHHGLLDAVFRGWPVQSGDEFAHLFAAVFRRDQAVQFRGIYRCRGSNSGDTGRELVPAET